MARIIQTFTDFDNRKWKDRIEGGRGDDKTPKDFDPYDITIGTSIEREHTSNPDIATEISIDHLSEDPEYYDKLITAGIADEEEAVELFNKVKGKNAREKSKRDIMDFMDEEDYDDDDDDNDDDYEDDENIEEYDEDELGTDKMDVENDELIIDDDIKNKKKIMEKSIVNYKSFLNLKESASIPEPDPIEMNDPGPERRYSKENKYKFQIQYTENTAKKLNDYNFTLYVPDDGKDGVTKPKKETHNIIIDILNLNYYIVDRDLPEIRRIDISKLKNLFDNL